MIDFTINKEQVEDLPFDLESPHLYRFCDKIAFENTINNGLLWFRPDWYFRKLEDEQYQDARSDDNEGGNFINLDGSHGIVDISTNTINGKIEVGNMLPKHYILSLSGHNVDLITMKRKFSDITHSFRIKNIRVLLENIQLYLFKIGYSNVQISYDEINYKYSKRKYHIKRDSLEKSIESGFDKNQLFLSIRPYNKKINFFNKRPLFSYQDEARIIIQIFNEKGENIYIGEKNNERLEIEVPNNLFSKNDIE